MSNVICIDTETTGTSKGRDEILSVAIVDGSGKELFYSLIRPAHRKKWDDAERINGISPDDVKMAPTLLECADRIEELLGRADVLVGYNLEFDIEMLQRGGISIPPVERFDVMREFAPIYGEWADWKNDWKWQRLEKCAEYYGYSFDAHNALEDARVTALCYWDVKKDIDDRSKIVAEIINDKRDAELKERHNKALTAFLLCLFLGFLGAHRFYFKQWKVGVIYFLTVGLFGIGWIVDCFRLGIALARETRRR